MSAAEAADLQRCCARLAHLVEQGQPARDAALAWNRPRLPRLLVDHLLRQGYYGSATQLASEHHIQVRASCLLLQ